MPDLAPDDSATGGVATAAPPSPPDAPPRTATSAPGPGRRRTSGWVVGLVVAAVVMAVLVGFTVWWAARAKPATGTFAASAAPFESAMKKAGVKAEFPQQPVDLADVKPTGGIGPDGASSHHFDATFTGEELSALMNTFPHTVATEGMDVGLTGVSLTLLSGGKVRISGTVSAGGLKYTGSAEGPVAFEGGAVTSSGLTNVQAEGVPAGGSQSQQVTTVLLGYLNGYLAAAPGLTVDSATVTDGGFHVTGTAPDALSYRTLIK